jgi:putative cell wall-binding protein
VTVSPQQGVAPITATASLRTALTDPPAFTGNDDLVVTFGSNALANTTYTVTVTGLGYIAGVHAPAYSGVQQQAILGVESIYVAQPGAPVGDFSGVKGPFPIGTVTAFSVTDSPGSLSRGSSNNGPFTLSITEDTPGEVHVGTVTTSLPPGLSFAAVPTVTATAGAGGLAPNINSPQLNSTGTQFSFNVNAASVGAPATFTISNVLLNVGPSTPLGPAIISFANSGGGLIPVPTIIGVVINGNLPGQSIAGPDAAGTAAAIFELTFNDKQPNVMLASDASFPDALSATYLSSQLGTGTLITNPTSLSLVTAQELHEISLSLPTFTVYVLGGPLAVSDGVLASVSNAAPNATILRVAGNTEYDTNLAANEAETPLNIGHVNLAAAFANAGAYNDTSGNESVQGANLAKTAIVASGTSFPDALAAGVLSYANHLPIVLTDGSSLSPQAAFQLASMGISQAILVGGPLAVSNTVEAQISNAPSNPTPGLGVPVLRVAGQDETDTAALLARLETSGQITGGVGTFLSPNGPFFAKFTPNDWVARGDFFSDALTAAPYLATAAAGGSPVPLLLTVNPTTAGPYIASYLNSRGRFGTIWQFGGQFAISPNMRALLQGYAIGVPYVAGQ